MALYWFSILPLFLSSSTAIRIRDVTDVQGPPQPFNNTFLVDFNETFDFNETIDFDDLPPRWKGSNNQDNSDEEEDEMTSSAVFEMFGIMFGVAMFFIVALVILKLYLM